jgi:transcription initiation factor TFIIF subunit alpha
MKLHAPRQIDPFTPSNDPQGWTHPLKLHRRDPNAPVLRPTGIEEDSKDIKPQIDLSVIAPYGGAQKAKKDLFKPKTKQVFHADPTELALRNEERTPWVLEDFDGKNTWVGTLEQGGASGYALFLFDNDGFKFVPVDRTYRFTKKGSNQVLSAEEAEAHMKRRNALPRWILKDRPPGGAGGSPTMGIGGGSHLFTVRESRERATDAMEEDLDYDEAEHFEDDEENPILEGDEEANKAIEERMRREQLGARNFESKEEELDEDIDLDDLFGTSKKVTKEGKRTKRYLKKLEGKADYDTDEEEENPYATEEETDSEAESIEKQEREKEKEKAKQTSASGTKPSSPSSTTDVKPGSTPTPGVSPVQKKKKDKDRTGTSTPKLQHRKKDSSVSGILTPSKVPSRKPSPKPESSRASSPKPTGPPSRAASPTIHTPVSVGPASPSAIPDPPPSQTSTSSVPSAPQAIPSSKSLIVRFQISPAGRKRLHEEEALAPVKRIKFNLKSGGQALSPSPPPEDRRPSIVSEPSRTASPDDYLITEEEIVNLIRSERLTTKQLLAKLKGKLKRHEGNKAIVGGVLKRRCRIVEGFLVLKD